MNALLYILKLLPALIAAITAIEAAIPLAGKGAEKLAAIKDIITQVDSTATVYWPQIQSVIAVLVGLFNATKTFGSRGESPAAPNAGA